MYIALYAGDRRYMVSVCVIVLAWRRSLK